MQRIEDLIDRYIEKGDMNAFNMLNAKYFITPEKQIQVNQAALGNAWFVSTLEYVESADEEIRMVGEIDVAKEAVVLKDEFIDIVDKVTVGDATGNINLVEYEPGFLKYDVSTTGDQVAVFSEVWYPDSWEVSIDGQPAEMFRVNYLLRALAIPNGAKEVVFAFQPKPQ